MHFVFLVLPLASDPELVRIILEPFGDVKRLSPAIPGPWWACPRCIDRGETGGERLIGDVELDGIAAACLVPASRIIGMPGIIGIGDPAKPGDLSFGDVTSLESENKNNDSLTCKTFQETGLTGNQYCNAVIMNSGWNNRCSSDKRALLTHLGRVSSRHRYLAA